MRRTLHLIALALFAGVLWWSISEYQNTGDRQMLGGAVMGAVGFLLTAVRLRRGYDADEGTTDTDEMNT